MNTVNSFAENVKDLTKSASDILNIAQAMNESISGNSAEVYIGNNISLPSFSNIVKRVERAEDTIAKFTQGKGIVETADGTFRKIRVSTISAPPKNITNVDDVSTFSINPNWFFESLQYPRCTVKLDLASTVEEDSDRAFVDRIIIDANAITNGITNIEFYNNNIAGQNLSYTNLINLLEINNIEYKEDKDEVHFPLTYEKYDGRFTVLNHGLIKDAKGVSRLWYFLDNTSYSTVDEAGQHINNGNVLNMYDYLRFNDSLYKIVDKETGNIKKENISLIKSKNKESTTKIDIKNNHKGAKSTKNFHFKNHNIKKVENRLPWGWGGYTIKLSDFDNIFKKVKWRE